MSISSSSSKLDLSTNQLVMDESILKIGNPQTSKSDILQSNISTTKSIDASPPSSSDNSNTVTNLNKYSNFSKNIIINSNPIHTEQNQNAIITDKIFTPPSPTAILTTTDSHEYNGIKIRAGYPHIATKLDAILEAPKFKKWLDDFNKEEIYFKEFTITDVDFFGPILPSKLGFLKGYGLAYDKITGDAIPSVVFMRGNSIAVLIIIKIQETKKSYVLLCKQLRFPAGRALTEACAGMLDDQSKNVVGVVFNEVQQETGFILRENELLDLGSIRPSGGGCDEIIHLYAWETEVTQEEFEE